jgi:hypothetical protein
MRTGRRFLNSEGYLAIAVRRKLHHVLASLGAETKSGLVGISDIALFARISQNFAATCGTEKKRKT